MLDESILGLELHHRVLVGVDESLSSAFVTSELSGHVHNDYLIDVGLELLGNGGLDDFLAWGSSSFVEDLNAELLSVQKRIGLNFSGSDDKMGCHL